MLQFHQIAAIYSVNNYQENQKMVQLAPLIPHTSVFLGDVGLNHRPVKLTPPVS